MCEKGAQLRSHSSETKTLLSCLNQTMVVFDTNCRFKFKGHQGYLQHHYIERQSLKNCKEQPIRMLYCSQTVMEGFPHDATAG